MDTKKQIKILLIEDEAITAQYMKTGLTKNGHSVKTTATGKKAIQSIEEERPDLILMDIHLAGGMDGIETMQRINEEYPIPVVFITGYVDESIKEKTLPFKTLAFLVKPVNINEIIEIINDSDI